MAAKTSKNNKRNEKQYKVCRVVLAVLFAITYILLWAMPYDSDEESNETTTQEPATVETTTYIYGPVNLSAIEEVNEPEAFDISDEEIELIALVTMAEAEGECEEGKRLVIDTILNRVDLDYWPDTVSEVIYQPSQFSSMWNGRVDRCYVMEDICQLVKEELVSRTNHDVVYFTAGGYGKYGEPMFSVGNHYFSSYD